MKIMMSRVTIQKVYSYKNTIFYRGYAVGITVREYGNLYHIGGRMDLKFGIRKLPRQYKKNKGLSC